MVQRFIDGLLFGLGFWAAQVVLEGLRRLF
jgi:Na+-translocating ferredoxin:NAD+ oxidoreductase RnfE subunit